MKQFLRYLLLIACVMVIGVWGVSYFEGYEITWKSYAISTYNGWIFLNDYTGLRDPRFGLYRLRSPNNLFFHLKNITIIHIWLLFTPLFLLTAGPWYRPIRDRLGGKTGKGFPVEMKSECRNQPDLNHEGESNPKSE